MEIRLEPDGLKITLPPDDMRLVERFFPLVKVQMELYLTSTLRMLVAIATLGEERLAELVEEYLKDGVTPDATVRLTAAVLGPAAVERLSLMAQEVTGKLTDEDFRRFWYAGEGKEGE